MQRIQKSRVTEWVHLCERWCEPEWVHWCDGSADEVTRLAENELNSEAPLTLLSAGGCVTPLEAIQRIALECRGSLRGLTMFVVPYLMPDNEAGVLVTDSAPRAAALCRTTQVGGDALSLLAVRQEFTATLCLKANGATPERIIRCHLSGSAPEDTDCRSSGEGRRARMHLTVDPQPAPRVNGASCRECERLCPNRARAIADAAGQQEVVQPSLPQHAS